MYKCECIECGHKLESERKFINIKCKKCGGYMSHISKGDVVESKKYGTKMIDCILCVWFDSEENIHRKIFMADSLTIVNG